jgi:predicted nucleic acid-binding protein
MLKVVINSTPLIALNAVNQLSILGALYKKIIVPYGVYEEVFFKAPTNKKIDLSLFDYILIERVKNAYAKELLQTSLHKGEIEVILLAQEINADLCIIDDYLARKYASLFGLKVTGTIGVLLRAKENQLIKEIKPILNDLIKNGIYISQELYEHILMLANEN